MNLMYDKEPTNCRFVAVYSDGSGASMFLAKDGYIYDTDLVLQDKAVLDDYMYWVAMPDDFRFLNEEE